MSLTIASALRSYSVTFASSLEFLGSFRNMETAFFVIDRNVWNHFQEQFSCVLEAQRLFLFDSNEENKDLEGVCQLYERLVPISAKKNLRLVCIGGGILQDVAGFVASTLYRGIRWDFIPTTLLAMADSCIGGKTSLNFQKYKNLLGTFYPPHAVTIFPGFLKTLPEEFYLSGLGEIIKLHHIAGRDYLKELKDQRPSLISREPVVLEKAIQRSLEIKAGFIQSDEFDTGRRNLLNFGHCFGHALESVSQFAIPHGLAVMVGMFFAALMAKNRGLISEATSSELIHSWYLPFLRELSFVDHLHPETIIDAMKNDKKRVGEGLPLVLFNEAMEFSRISDLTPDEIKKGIEEIRSFFPQ